MIQYAKINPVGVDKWIDRFQTLQQRELPALFGVSEATCLFYGRSELNDDKQVVFISGIDYVPIDFSTDYSFISYFVFEPAFRADGLIQIADASLYCHGDLSKLFPTITHRSDEELRQAMRTFILMFIEPQEMGNIEFLERLQPFHSFKINFEIRW